ncbi:unnamed protein product [Gulo gulo]|uniref:Uncharacterized protein n=1 Tax=Gulo gulo TaxID=48420 RepID=A0A9X9PSK4_GULGU|nr:unnamed protein product [Gulo gulo]
MYRRESNCNIPPPITYIEFHGHSTKSYRLFSLGLKWSKRVRPDVQGQILPVLPHRMK